MIEQVSLIFWDVISHVGEDDINHKSKRFSHMCDTIKRSLKSKRRVDTKMKFCRTVAIRNGMYGCETWGITSRGKSRLQSV